MLAVTTQLNVRLGAMRTTSSVLTSRKKKILIFYDATATSTSNPHFRSCRGSICTNSVFESDALKWENHEVFCVPSEMRYMLYEKCPNCRRSMMSGKKRKEHEHIEISSAASGSHTVPLKPLCMKSSTENPSRYPLGNKKWVKGSFIFVITQVSARVLRPLSTS